MMHLKNVNLYIPDSVKELFKSKYALNYLKGKKDELFIDLLKFNEDNFAFECESLEIKLGERYPIDLSIYKHNELVIEFKMNELGLIVLIDSTPFCLFVLVKNQDQISKTISNYHAIQILDFSNLASLELENITFLSAFKNLTHLNFQNCIVKSGIDAVFNLQELKVLKLKGMFNKFDFSNIPPNNNLLELDVRNTSKLQSLNGIEKFINLEKLNVSFCSSLENISSIERLPKLKQIDIQGCYRIDSSFTLSSNIELKVIKTQSILDQKMNYDSVINDVNSDIEWYDLITEKPMMAQYLPKVFYDDKEFMKKLLSANPEVFNYLVYLK
jgi:hypothetical protein